MQEEPKAVVTCFKMLLSQSQCLSPFSKIHLLSLLTITLIVKLLMLMRDVVGDAGL